MARARATRRIRTDDLLIIYSASETSGIIGNRIEHCGCLDIGGFRVRADANIAGELAKRDIPIPWSRRQLLGKWMLACRSNTPISAALRRLASSAPSTA
jgi:hypothetical protein